MGKIPGPAAGAFRVTLVYLVIGMLWIFLSDSVLNLFTNNRQVIQVVSICKGILYVAATGFLLFILIRRALRKEAAYSSQLDESYARLQEHFNLLNAASSNLVESEEQYRTLFNAMLAGYCVHEIVQGEDSKPAGIRTLNTNPAFWQIAGNMEGELPENCLFRLLPGDVGFWLDGFSKVVASGSTMHFQVYSESVRKYLEFTVFRPAPERFATIISDITARKQMEKALDAESEQLRVTLESIGDGVISADTSGNVTMLNGVAEQLTGWRQDEALGRPITDVLKPHGGRSGPHFASLMKSMADRGEAIAIKNEMHVRAKDGTERVISGNIAPMAGSDGIRLGFVLVFRDVTAQQQKEAEILYLSYHDLLTGLYNRNFFEEELRRLDTERQLPLSIIMGDANNLKLVNDVFGHREGDELLMAMAQVLKDSCRTEDIISRWGGDEFTILLPRTNRESAELICRRITTKCRKQFTTKRLFPSISLGFDTKEAMDSDIGHVIKAAEDMMYKNKLLDSRTAHNEFLSAMRSRIGEGDLETEEHTSHVSELCERVGREMDLKGSELADLRLLSTLHDIGKAAVDPRILTKPGSLTDAEWEEIKRHSGLGYRIVRSAPELVMVADYILGHHERWDGLGYPQGLKGTAIPLASRIFAVVDAFDVMTHGRPYKEAISQETALMELYRNAGTQFDPGVVNVFASVLNSWF